MKTIAIKNKEQIQEVIGKCDVCYVGVVDTEGLPYVVPMNFGYDKEYIYLHGASVGKLIDSLKLNPQVCVTFCTPSDLVWQDAHVGCSYRVRGESVVARGDVEFITDFEKKVEALNILMGNYSKREFKYSSPAVRNVEIYRVRVQELTGKAFGVSHKKQSPWENSGKDLDTGNN